MNRHNGIIYETPRASISLDVTALENDNAW